jgi:hypothetical protein
MTPEDAGEGKPFLFFDFLAGANEVQWGKIL